VVDDNELNCQLIAGFFAGSHHQLAFGNSGQEAVAKSRALKPDIVLLDIRMPGMDGREALAEIRRIAGLELLPVIAVTASSLLTEELDLKDRFNGYVRKPFSKRELFDELAQFLPRHETPAPGTDAGAAPAASAASAAASPAAAAPELIAKLRRLAAEEWPALRQGMAINETKAFALNLETLARQWGCKPLNDYARMLARDADNYAVVDLERNLAEFSHLVERLGADHPQPQ